MKLPNEEFTPFENALLMCLQSIAINTEIATLVSVADNSVTDEKKFGEMLDILNYFSVGVYYKTGGEENRKDGIQ